MLAQDRSLAVKAQVLHGAGRKLGGMHGVRTCTGVFAASSCSFTTSPVVQLSTSTSMSPGLILGSDSVAAAGNRTPGMVCGKVMLRVSHALQVVRRGALSKRISEGLSTLH